MLGELPELAGMLGALAEGDRSLVDAVVRLAGLRDTGEVEAGTLAPAPAG